MIEGTENPDKENPEETKNSDTDAVEVLVAKATKAPTAIEALQLSQAACNVASARRTVAETGRENP